MWARPDGRRVLVAATEEAAGYVAGVYTFDEVVVGPLDVSLEGGRLRLAAPGVGLRLGLSAGRGVAVPWPRPAWFTRWVEGPVARSLLGVRTYGVSPTGVQEWYRAVSYRRLVAGRASLAEADLGPMGDVDPPTRFGFSEPPRRPSMVGVRPLLRRPRPRRGPG